MLWRRKWGRRKPHAKTIERRQSKADTCAHTYILYTIINKHYVANSLNCLQNVSIGLCECGVWFRWGQGMRATTKSSAKTNEHRRTLHWRQTWIGNATTNAEVVRRSQQHEEKKVGLNAKGGEAKKKKNLFQGFKPFILDYYTANLGDTYFLWSNLWKTYNDDFSSFSPLIGV